MKSSSGEPISGRIKLVADHFATILMPRFLSLPRKHTFSSVRTIAESLAIPVSRFYSHLVEKISLKIFLLCWVPHALTSGLRQKRIELSNQLLLVLESQQRVGFNDIVAGHESWFFQYYHHQQIWCISADEVPTRVTQTIVIQKQY
jgi:hypothetical protein